MGEQQIVRKPRVLLVDDTRANALALEAVLGDEYQVFVASSGHEALSFLTKRHDMDIILMDVQMPGMDGFEAAAEVKKVRGCEDIPIVFVTAVYSEDPFIKRGYQAGGIDYFAKPFDPEILKLKVAIYASFRQKASLLRERELHIRESEELLKVGRKLSSMLESLPVGVLIADIEGRICQATDEVARILKCTAPIEQDAYGVLLGWWHADGGAIRSEQSPLGRALHAGESSHSERLTIRCLDGSNKSVVVSASPLRGLDARMVGAVVLLQDLTETAKIGEDLENRVTRLIGLGVELEESVGR